uniref:Secreted CUB domain protein n=1 Tax=Pristhesancus plagipennis TaxID=1955184 RepID=A0A2K8JMJ9_PRIPG|nr:secreted CUB domain protein [Pristhesancus plagipennis]
MRVLLGLIFCTCALYGSVKADDYEVSNATAIVRGLPLRRFFDRWNPKGLRPYTEFVYTVITDPDKTLQIHCPYISLHQPCEEYSLDIIDGQQKKRICGKVKKFYYNSTTSKVDVLIRTGPKLVKVAPRCSARPLKKN